MAAEFSPLILRSYNECVETYYNKLQSKQYYVLINGDLNFFPAQPSV